ncbi:MAG TPA: septation protein SepH [Mycobacteriales bacterium]|nr:septation protein SepH [Mycobacteriales bacterium]
MRQLQFVGVSDDGAQLLFRDPASRDQFQVPLDERLRAASRNDRSRLGQIELELSSTLRPREIQARIRAGETPEAVAAAADAPLQRVMRFAYPVLQEREQVTIEARRTRIRRSDSARRLGDQVDDRLIKQGVDPDATTWDAFRREDGSWWVTLRWQVGDKTVTAQWSFDLPGRTLTPADDVAAELQAEQPRRRRIAAVPFVPDEEPEDEAEEAAYETADPEPATRLRTAGAHPAGRSKEREQPRPEPSRREPRPEPTRREQPRRPIRMARPQEPERFTPDPEDLPPGPVSVVSAPQRRAEPSAPQRRAEHSGTETNRVEPSRTETNRVEPGRDEPEPVEPPAEPMDRTPPPDHASDEDGDAEDVKTRPSRGRKPKVPSWDDIVFGTRGRK